MVAVTGEANRKIFFNSRGLDFNQGYRILSGGTPSLKNINVHIGGPYDVTDFIKRLLLLLRQERVDKGAPETILCFIVETHSYFYLSTSSPF